MGNDTWTRDEIKRNLINNGPLASGIMDLGHAMMMVGYEEDWDWPIWIFKDSFGPDRGEGGYVKIKTPLRQLALTWSYKGPFETPAGTSYQISCVDKDRDGYCNWGISENKPSTCAASCKPEKDYDDSNPKINITPNGDCLPGTKKACGNGGTQTCSNDYQWGACANQCPSGQVYSGGACSK